MASETGGSGVAYWRRGDFIYASCLFAIALAAVAFSISRDGFLARGYGWDSALLFFGFAVFAITVGFPHPKFGHVSFDRAAQVAAILVLGPVDAAWINGLASFLFPWHRLARGVRFPTVLLAALNNAGLMTLVILLSGTLYEYLGGPVPLDALGVKTAGLLLLLMLSMQALNDLGMMVILYLRNMDPRSLFNWFTLTIETLSVLVAIVVAYAYTSTPVDFLVLLLAVVGSGMLVIKQYAVMRLRLEALVAERTEELRVQAIEFERQATHDKLTGLPNRRFADDFLEQELEIARRNGVPVTVALADIDHFKMINDQFSHAVGDQVLRRVAGLMRDRCRKSDVVARYGGEEFLLCFPATDSVFAEKICDEIRLSVESTNWAGVRSDSGVPLSVTISIGLAESNDSSRMTTMLSEADARLYLAKTNGRNLVVAN